MLKKSLLTQALLSATLVLTGCGGSSGGNTAADSKDFTLSGSVSGLTGTLDLINTSNQETVSIAGNSFSFSQKLADQAQYEIKLASVADGQQLCEVIDGTGSVNAASVTDIEIVCRDWAAAATTMNSGTAEARWPKITRVGDALEVLWFDRQIGQWLFKRAYDATNGWGDISFDASVDGYRENSHKLVANSQGEGMQAYRSTRPHFTGEYIFARNDTDLSVGSFSDQGRTYEYDIDIDEQGHVLLVWTAPDDLVPAEKSVYYRYFNGSWGAKIKVETNTTGDARNPVVKFTGNGVAVAAWEFAIHPGSGPGILTYDGVQVATFDASKAADNWTGDSSIDTASGGCGQVVNGSIDIDVTEDGTPAVAWMQGNGQCANFYQPLQVSKLEQSIWSAPINISGANSASSHAEILALTGNKILAAYNDDSKTYVKTCDLTTDICTQATELATEYREIQSLAKDKNNNVMAAWLEFDTGNNPKDLYVNRYDAVNDSWSVMSKINSDTVGQSNNVAVLDNDFVVTWSENVNLSSSTLWTVFAKEFKTQ